jgi:hypothetical protein
MPIKIRHRVPATDSVPLAERRLSNPTVALDYDGVLAESISGIRQRIHNIAHLEMIGSRGRFVRDMIFETAVSYANIAPERILRKLAEISKSDRPVSEDAVSAMLTMQQAGASLQVRTSNPILNREALERRLSAEGIMANVLYVRPKMKWANIEGTKPDILIDDTPSVARAAAVRGCGVMLLRKNYNRAGSWRLRNNGNVARVDSLEEAAEKIRGMVRS